ncbi:hypothetical protein [Providencia stuartii]|uniref:hypothetical protein n=1 Tax=Providencia stuartii TaxID=588 RepID=UPI0011214848|nr:hypothetical protein [Providencia stuartii]
MKKLLIGALLTFFSVSSMAVDGYKNIKFGDTVKQVLNSKLCNFEKMPNTSGLKQMSQYGCTDFKFSGKPSLVVATFIDDKFRKLIINVDPDINPLLNSLMEKYGAPNAMSSQDELNKAQVNSDEYSLFVDFDKGTVSLQVEKSKNKPVMALLIYSDINFDKELSEIKNKNLAEDI